MISMGFHSWSDVSATYTRYMRALSRLGRVINTTLVDATYSVDHLIPQWRKWNAIQVAQWPFENKDLAPEGADWKDFKVSDAKYQEVDDQ